MSLYNRPMLLVAVVYSGARLLLGEKASSGVLNASRTQAVTNKM